MATPTYGRDPLSVDIGPGLVYMAPLGTAEPADPTDPSWPSTWAELGYTETGSEFKITPTVDDVMVAEETTPVKQIVSAVKSTLVLSMAQITAFNFAAAMGGGTIVTSTGYVSFEPPVTGTEAEVMLGWRDIAKTEMMLWRRCKTDGAIDIKRQSGNNKAALPVTFSVLIPSGKRPWRWMGQSPQRQGIDASVIFPGINQLPPTLTTVAPAVGGVAGGTAVTLTGTNFTGITQVTFGGTPATNLVVVSATSITCTSPAHTAGVVDVVASGPAGSATKAASFTYS